MGVEPGGGDLGLLGTAGDKAGLGLLGTAGDKAGLGEVGGEINGLGDPPLGLAGRAGLGERGDLGFRGMSGFEGSSGGGTSFGFGVTIIVGLLGVDHRLLGTAVIWDCYTSLSYFTDITKFNFMFIKSLVQ